MALTETTLALAETTQAADIFEIGTSVISDTRALLGAALGVLGIIAAIAYIFKGGVTLTKIILGAIMGGLIAALTTMIIIMSGALTETVDNAGNDNVASGTVYEQISPNMAADRPQPRV